MALTEHELRSLDYEPDAGGHFGDYGGRYVSETLMAALSELDQNYQKLKNDPDFQREFDADLASFVGRPSPLYHADRWSKAMAEHRFTSSEKISTILERTKLTIRLVKRS